MNDEPVLAELWVDWANAVWLRRLRRSGLTRYVRRIAPALLIWLLLLGHGLYMFQREGRSWFLLYALVLLPLIAVLVAWQVVRYVSNTAALARATGGTTYRVKASGLSFQHALGHGTIPWTTVEGMGLVGGLWEVRYARVGRLSLPDGPLATEARRRWQAARSQR